MPFSESELRLPSALAKLTCVHLLAWVFGSWTLELLSDFPNAQGAQTMGVTGTFSLRAEEEPSPVCPGEPSKQPPRERGRLPALHFPGSSWERGTGAELGSKQGSPGKEDFSES